MRQGRMSRAGHKHVVTAQSCCYKPAASLSLDAGILDFHGEAVAGLELQRQR